MPQLSPELNDLVARIRVGDDGAMAELLAVYGPTFRAVAAGLIGSPLRPHLDPEDLLQSAQLVLWLGLRSGRFKVSTPKKLHALVKLLLKRNVARHWRRIKNLADTAETDLSATLAERPAPAPMPKEQPEFDDLVEELLAQMDEVDRKLVKLRFEGCTTREVALQLGVEPGYLRVRLVRLRKRFAHFRERLKAACRRESHLGSGS